MTSAQHPGQLLLVGVPGPELDPRTAAVLRRVQPGGYILFTRNLRTPAALRRLVDDLRDLSAVEPIVTIDQEGGRVSRLRALGHEPPSATQLRTRDDPALVSRHGELTARLLRLFGFNLDLAPVLDVCLDGDETADNSLRGRCYGVDPAQVVRLAGAFTAALRAGGIRSCGKHFPGYTAARADAHHELPVIARTRAELAATELAPFRQFVAADLLDAVLVAHAHYPHLEAAADLAAGPAPAGGNGAAPLRPASLSPTVIEGLLRRELGFRGLVMTDDLDMGAIYYRYRLEEALGQALAAGNDLAMICHRVDHLDEAVAALERQPAAVLDRALTNVAAFKQRLAPPVPRFDEAAFAELNAEVWQLRVEVLGPEEAGHRSAEDGKRSPVEIY